MKSIALILAALLIAASPAYALFGVGDVVYDPVVDGAIVETRIETLTQLAEQMKKFEAQIENQMKQIDEAKKLFSLQNEVRTEIGDWQGVLDRAKSIQLSAQNITDVSADTKVTGLLTLDYGQPGLDRTVVGGTAQITTKDAFGSPVSLTAQQSNRFLATDNAFTHFFDVYNKTDKSINDTRAELATTYDDMNKPGLTQADFTKLATKAEALTARLNSLNAQRTQASEALKAQEAANENQKAKEDAAEKAVQDSNHQTLSTQLNSLHYAPFEWR